MLSKTYRVHSAQIAPVTIDADYEGAKIQAKVPGLVVELVAVDGSGSHTASFVVKEEEIQEAAATYRVGAEITVSYEAAAKTEEIT